MSVPHRAKSLTTRRLRIGGDWLRVFFCGAVLSCSYTSTVPETQLPNSFSSNGQVVVQGRWWDELSDATLQGLIEQAFSTSLDYRKVWARLRQAEATAAVAGADLWPTVGLSAGVSERWESGGSTRTYRLSAPLSYELDLFGKNRAGKNAARLDYRAAEFEVQIAASVLAGEIAKAWYEYLAALEQVTLIDQQIETAEQLEKLVEIRYRAGQVNGSDVLRQRQSTESLRYELSAAHSSVSQLQHALNALRGKAPKTPLPNPVENAVFPAFPQTGIPAEVVFARPDVMQAVIKVKAADARVAQAMRARFPSLSFSAEVGATGPQVSSLLDSWFLNLGANLLAPLFEGGRLQAQVDLQKSLAKEQALDAGQVILNAVREIEDALVVDVQRREQFGLLESQLKLATRAEELLKKQFAKGQVEYLAVLDAVTTQERVARSFVEAKSQKRIARLQLYRSLARGFTPTIPEEN